MAELKGIFYYGETKNGHFNFHLKAPNRETVGVCEGAYADLRKAQNLLTVPFPNQRKVQFLQ